MADLDLLKSKQAVLPSALDLERLNSDPELLLSVLIEGTFRQWECIGSFLGVRSVTAWHTMETGLTGVSNSDPRLISDDYKKYRQKAISNFPEFETDPASAVGRYNLDPALLPDKQRKAYGDFLARWDIARNDAVPLNIMTRVIENVELALEYLDASSDNGTADSLIKLLALGRGDSKIESAVLEALNILSEKNSGNGRVAAISSRITDFVMFARKKTGQTQKQVAAPFSSDAVRPIARLK